MSWAHGKIEHLDGSPVKCPREKKTSPCSGAVDIEFCMVKGCNASYPRCAGHGGTRGAKASLRAHAALAHGPGGN